MIFQDFPGPGIFEKKNPGLSRTFQEACEPCGSTCLLTPSPPLLSSTAVSSWCRRAALRCLWSGPSSAPPTLIVCRVCVRLAGLADTHSPLSKLVLGGRRDQCKQLRNFPITPLFYCSRAIRYQKFKHRLQQVETDDQIYNRSPDNR